MSRYCDGVLCLRGMSGFTGTIPTLVGCRGLHLCKLVSNCLLVGSFLFCTIYEDVHIPWHSRRVETRADVLPNCSVLHPSALLQYCAPKLTTMCRILRFPDTGPPPFIHRDRLWSRPNLGIYQSGLLLAIAKKWFVTKQWQRSCKF